MSENRPSVLVVSQKFPPEKGGNASRIGDLTDNLSDRLDLTVVAPTPSFRSGTQEWSWDRVNYEYREGNDVFRLWCWQLLEGNPSFVQRLLHYFTFVVHALVWLIPRRDEYDVILTTTPPIFTGMVGFPLAVFTQTCWILDVRDLWIDVSTDLGFISPGGLTDRVSRWYKRLEYSHVDYVTVTSDKTAEIIEDRYSPAAPISVIPNGVDTSQFRPFEEPTEYELIYTGNLGYAQDLNTCIRALEHLNDDIRFRVVGTGDIKSDLEALAANLGVRKQVEFTGLVPRDEIPRFLSKSKIGVAPLADRPTLEYAIPTKVYEYMACGLPVVGVGHGEIERVLDESQAGCCSSNDPKQLANLIDDLLNDDDRRHRLGSNGRKYVQDHYDRRSIADDIAKCIKELCRE